MGERLSREVFDSDAKYITLWYAMDNVQKKNQAGFAFFSLKMKVSRMHAFSGIMEVGGIFTDIFDRAKSVTKPWYFIDDSDIVINESGKFFFDKFYVLPAYKCRDYFTSNEYFVILKMKIWKGRSRV